MRYEEYVHNISQIKQLEELLEKITEDRVIERIGLESRLSRTREKMKDVPVPPAPRSMRINLHGNPGMGVTAIGLIADAIAIANADMGEDPHPAGATTGSFTLELELRTEGPEEKDNHVLNAMRMVYELIAVSAEDPDSGTSQTADDLHPRTVRKVNEFLDLVKSSDTRFTMDFDDRRTRIQTGKTS